MSYYQVLAEQSNAKESIKAKAKATAAKIPPKPSEKDKPEKD